MRLRPVCFRSSSQYLPVILNRVTFPRSLTTTPFERSSTGWFEACPCRPASGGQLPSSVQHHELTLVFVTHTRPRLLTGSRALRATPGSLAAAGLAPAALRWSAHQAGGPHRAPPALPSCESTGPSARTPSRVRRDYARLAPALPFGVGTPTHTLHDSWASWFSFISPLRHCPRNRVNSSAHCRRHLPSGIDRLNESRVARMSFAAARADFRRGPGRPR